MKKSFALILLSLVIVSCRLEPFAIPQVYLNNGDLRMNILTEVSAVSALSISPDGRYILTVDNGGTFTASDMGIVRMWDITDGRQIFMRKNTLKMAMAVAFSPDGRYAVTGGETRPFLNRGSVKKEEEREQYGLNVWDLSAGTIIKKFAGFKGPGMYVCDIKFSRDGRYFLASSYKQIYVFDAKTWKAVRKFPVNRGLCVAADFSPDGNKLLFGDGDGFFHLLDIETSKEIWSIQGHKPSFAGMTGASAIVFSPDGKSVLTSWGNDETVRLWETANGKLHREFKGFKRAEALSGVNGLALSPDGTQVMIFARPLKTWDVKSGKELVDFSGAWKGQQAVYTGNALSGVYHPDGRRVALNLSDAAVRIYDALTGAELAMFIGFGDGEWIVITSEGYYNASEKGAEYLSVKIGEASFSVNSFYDVFYRPDIVAAKLRGEDIGDLITITMRDAIKNPPPVVEISPIAPPQASPKAKVCYNVKSTGGGIGEIRVFHNGKLIESDGYYKEAVKTASEKTVLAKLDSKAIYDDMRALKIKGKLQSSPALVKSKGDAFGNCREIDAVSGENEISITAFNKDNTVQSYMRTSRFTSGVKPGEPNLYILSIGIDKYRDDSISLKYAVKDSSDIKDNILRQAGTLYDPKNIHYEILANENASKADIINKIGELSAKIKPSDGFILFAAGHGLLFQNQYYMLTYDFDGEANDNNLISSNEFVEISKKIKSLSQLFIFDTCHAGGVDYIVSGLYDARMSVLAKKMGLHIYASSSSVEQAMDGYQGNGLFTYTLLDGLNNNRSADKNNDNRVSLVELGEYSKAATTEISKGLGHRQTPLIINFGKDNPVYNLK